MKKIKKSFGYAMHGIGEVYKKEQNFRLHVYIAGIAIIIGIIMDFQAWKWATLVLTISLVLSLEIVNSAIEYTWNHLEPNHHPVVGMIKDVTAGAVFIAAFGAAIIGAILLFA